MGGVGECKADVLLDCGLGNPDPSFMSSPRMRSTPQRLFSLAICWVNAVVSEATPGRPPQLWDLNLQNSRKP